MKKSLNPKLSGLTFWTHSSEHGRHYVGTRHMLVSMQHVEGKLRQTLASYGLYEANKQVSDKQEPIDSMLKPEKILHSANTSRSLTKTPYLKEVLGRICRVFLTANGKEVFANEIYVNDVEKLFGDQLLWSMGQDERSPIIYGSNYQALILPIVADSTDKMVVNWR